MDKNTLTRKIHICTADYDLCHLNAEKYLTFRYHNITFCCFLFVGYERCTYPDEDGYYHYCNIGSCCKKSGTWYCTRLGGSTRYCHSVSE